MLTKEECNEALEHIKTLRGSNYGWYYSGFNNSALPFDEDTNVISKLIKEHFDNPPLKFYELEENMWVWDNKRKVKLLIAYCYSEDDMGYYNLSNPEDYKYTHIEFEENRFYRKEVHDV